MSAFNYSHLHFLLIVIGNFSSEHAPFATRKLEALSYPHPQNLHDVLRGILVKHGRFSWFL
jgi:hypothetical protein